MTDTDRLAFESWKTGRSSALQTTTDWDAWRMATIHERERARTKLEECARQNGLNGLEERRLIFEQAAFLVAGEKTPNVEVSGNDRRN